MTTAPCPNTECDSYNQDVLIESVRDINGTFQHFACEWCGAQITAGNITWAAGEGPLPDEQ